MIQTNPQVNVYRAHNDLIPGEFVLFLFMVMGFFYLQHVANQSCVVRTRN